jgi:hypothetical protein
MTNAKLRFCGTLSSRGDASGHLKAAGDAVLIERGRPRLLVLRCPCGCGEDFPINLDGRSGPAWRLYGDHNSSLSVFPSVWRENGCKSHYIIWRGTILLFGRNEEEFDEVTQDSELVSLSDSVLSRLSISQLTPFVDLADALNAVPWDVLMACRRLVHRGAAREGVGKQRGSFGRVK